MLELNYTALSSKWLYFVFGSCKLGLCYICQSKFGTIVSHLAQVRIFWHGERSLFIIHVMSDLSILSAVKDLYSRTPQTRLILKGNEAQFEFSG